MTKYKSGDIVHVRLADCDAAHLNEYGSTGVSASNIIAHHPAPEPVVRWANVYSDKYSSGLYDSRAGADIGCADSRTCVLRLEWPDGDTSKKPVVTVENI